MDIDIDKYIAEYKECSEMNANYLFSKLGCDFVYNICPFYSNNAVDDVKIANTKYNILKPELKDRPIIVFQNNHV